MQNFQAQNQEVFNVKYVTNQDSIQEANKPSLTHTHTHIFNEEKEERCLWQRRTHDGWLNGVNEHKRRQRRDRKQKTKEEERRSNTEVYGQEGESDVFKI